MLSEDELKRIYLNDKIKEIIPFFKKLTLKKAHESSVILKKKDWRYNHGYVLVLLASTRTRGQYKKQAQSYYELPVNFPHELFKSYMTEWAESSCLFVTLNKFLRYTMNCPALIRLKLIRLLHGN